MQLFYPGFIDLHKFQPDVVATVSERPFASSFARRQVEMDGETVTTLNGTNLNLDDKLAARLLLLLDGTRDINAINVEMTKSGSVKAEDQVDELADQIQSILKKFADFGLLVS